MEISLEPPSVGNDEEAVRRYLAWLKDPASVKDTDAIEDLRSRASEESLDEIDRLRLYSDLERAERFDGRDLESRFIASAKPFAVANDIEPAAFKRMKVPDEILRRAGLASQSRGKKKAPRSSPRGIDTLVSSLPAGNFKVEDVVSKTGSNAGTVRNQLKRLLEEGIVELVGTEKNGRGKPANIYRRSNQVATNLASPEESTDPVGL